MKNRKIGKLTAAGFVILICLVVVILLSNSLRRSSHIVLPDLSKTNQEHQGGLTLENVAITPISVTPETVQAAIESLHRETDYRRTIKVERMWSGGSGTSEIKACVTSGWTRTDVTSSSGQTRHSMTNGETTYIWYGKQKSYCQYAAGEITADQEQEIPTYEDVLELPVTQIEKADYRAISGVNCIYVETGEDENGRVSRYWISVNTGLLTMAEWLKDGQTIYRMSSLTLEAMGPTTEDFTLPDGTVLAKLS